MRENLRNIVETSVRHRVGKGRIARARQQEAVEAVLDAIPDDAASMGKEELLNILCGALDAQETRS